MKFSKTHERDNIARLIFKRKRRRRNVVFVWFESVEYIIKLKEKLVLSTADNITIVELLYSIYIVKHIPSYILDV